MKLHCSLCGEARRQYAFSVKDFFSDYRFAVIECPSCELMQTVVSNDVAYPPAYFGRKSGRYLHACNWMAERLYGLRARKIHSYFRKPGRLVDMGCGNGQFMAAMQAFGWNVTGVESNPREQQKVISSEAFLGEAIARSSVDLVTYWHSLEHLTDFAGYLQKTFELLAPDGLLLIEVPNIRSFQSRLAGERWLHLDCPRHRTHFCTRTLTALLQKHGFVLRSLRTFSMDVGLFGAVQSWLDLFTFQSNFLYRFLQPACRNRLHPTESLFDLLVTGLLLPLLVPLGVAGEILSSLFCSGGVICVVAEKKRGLT